MRRLLPIVCFWACLAVPLVSQERPAVTASYLYMNNAGSHGVGIGFQKTIWKKLTLLTDVNYFFRNYEGVFHEKSRIESHTRYAALNVNAGYFLSPIPKIHLIPYVGVCLFHENIDGYFDSDGTYVSYPGNGYPSVHVSIDDRITTPTANIGLLAGYYLTNSFFITGGIKYMWDPYDGTYNSFPYTSMGIGYRF